jgi:iron complex transport system substrate-binding protein
MRKIGYVVALMLCITLAVAPAIASSFTLGIYGNANMDEDIDEKDIAYVEGVIKGTNAPTNLSDANYDGKVDDKDIDQIELIISGDKKELTIIDDAGDVETIHMPVNRVVTVHWSVDDSMRILGLADRIVAVEKNTKEQTSYFPELSKLTCFGDGFGEMDYELIMKTHPDLFIVRYTEDYKKEPEKMLPGVTVISMTLSHPEYAGKSFEERMIKFGYIFNKIEEAKKFVAWQENCLKDLREPIKNISEDDKPRVFYGYYKDGIFKIHITSGGGQLLDIVSAQNIGKDLPKGDGHPVIETEWLVEQNPDIIIIDAEVPVSGYETDDLSGLDAVREAILDLPELKNVDAVKNNRVYVLPSRCLTYRPGYNVGAAYLAKWIYPVQFKDFNPLGVHQEYLDLLGLDYNVSEHGVFVYPPLNES